MEAVVKLERDEAYISQSVKQETGRDDIKGQKSSQSPDRPRSPKTESRNRQKSSQKKAFKKLARLFVKALWDFNKT
jgi:hypothetical protein